jgi:hypothetical protein
MPDRLLAPSPLVSDRSGVLEPAHDPRYPSLIDRAAVYAGPFQVVSLDGERVLP